MARNGSGVYSLPAGYLATTGTTATSAQHNDPLEDLESDMNVERPIVAGGTGANTAATARTNLGLDSISDSGILDTVGFLDDADNTKVFKVQLSGITTSTTRTWTVPDSDDTFVGLAATQTLTNKSLSDSTTSIIDNSDNTKAVQFEVSGVTTGTTRTWTFPDEDGKFVGRTNTQTLTNKSLTAPIITGAADISGATGFLGRFLDVQQFASSGTYTPTSGAKYARVEMQAPGAGGGNGNASGTGEVGAGNGGGRGGRLIFWVDVSAIGTSTITIGAAGAGATTAGGDGADGGDASWDDGTTSATAYGGTGGTGMAAQTDTFLNSPSAFNSVNSVTAGANHLGTELDQSSSSGQAGMVVAGTAIAAIAGSGDDSAHGAGGRGLARNTNGSNVGVDARGKGAGGGGGVARGSVSGGANGGDGGGGVVFVTEFSE